MENENRKSEYKVRVNILGQNCLDLKREIGKMYCIKSINFN
jgi:hypothetical protein